MPSAISLWSIMRAPIARDDARGDLVGRQDGGSEARLGDRAAACPRPPSCAASCARIVPPAATMRAAPSAPSRPMPLRDHADRLPAHKAGDEHEHRIDRRPAPAATGPSLEPDTSRCRWRSPRRSCARRRERRWICRRAAAHRRRAPPPRRGRRRRAAGARNSGMNELGRCWVIRIGTLTRSAARASNCAERVDAAGRGADRQQMRAALGVRAHGGCAGGRRLGPARAWQPAPSRRILRSSVAQYFELPSKLPGPAWPGCRRRRATSAASVCSAPRTVSDETTSMRAPRPRARSSAERVEAAHAGHVEIEQDDVGLALDQRRSARSALPAAAASSKSAAPAIRRDRPPRTVANRRQPAPARDRRRAGLSRTATRRGTHRASTLRLRR